MFNRIGYDNTHRICIIIDDGNKTGYETNNATSITLFLKFFSERLEFKNKIGTLAVISAAIDFIDVSFAATFKNRNRFFILFEELFIFTSHNSSFPSLLYF